MTYTDLIPTELLYLGLYFSFESLFSFFSLTGDFIYSFTLKLLYPLFRKKNRVY